jgi:EmrB/QacA subfamily drug resistance transporter
MEGSSILSHLEAIVSSSQLLVERPTPAAPRVEQRKAHPNIALAVILTVQLMLVLDVTVVNIALPRIQEVLHFSQGNLSWVLNAYLLTFGGLLLLGGRMGDLFGRKRLFIGGVALFALASLAGGLATSAGWLVATRAAQGIGAALAAPSALALLMISFPEGPRRNRALSYFTAVSSAGGSIGLILGGMLTAWVSWRWVLFINVPIAIAVVALAVRFIAGTTRQRGRLDLAGALTSTLGMGALVYAFIRAGTNGWNDAGTRWSIALAAAVLAVFVLIETRRDQPVMPLHLLASRGRVSAFVSVICTVAAMYGGFFFLTQFLQRVLGFSPVETGIAFLPMTLSIFAISRIVPRLIPSLGPRRILIGGAALVALATLWFTQISISSHYAPTIVVPMILLGLGVGSSFLPLSIIVLSGVPAREAGAASGLLQTMQQVGGALGLSILVTAFGTATRAVPVRLLVGAAPALRADIVFTHGLTSVYTLAAIFALLSLANGLLVLRSPARPQSAAPVVASE